MTSGDKRVVNVKTFNKFATRSTSSIANDFFSFLPLCHDQAEYKTFTYQKKGCNLKIMLQSLDGSDKRKSCGAAMYASFGPGPYTNR